MDILKRLKTALGGVCSLTNYSVAYEEIQSNRVSDFRDFVCSFFPKAILFTFITQCGQHSISTDLVWVMQLQNHSQTVE